MLGCGLLASGFFASKAALSSCSLKESWCFGLSPAAVVVVELLLSELMIVVNELYGL